MEDFGGFGGFGEAEAVADLGGFDAEADGDEFGEGVGPAGDVFGFGDGVDDAGVLRLGAVVEIDEGADDVAVEGAGEFAAVEADAVEADFVVNFGLGEGAAAVGGHGLAEDGFGNLAVEPVGGGLEDAGSRAGLAGGLADEFDFHGLGDDGGGVGSEAADGAAEDVAFVGGGFGAVFADAEGHAVGFEEAHPVAEGVVFAHVGDGGDAGEAAGPFHAGAEAGVVDGEFVGGEGDAFEVVGGVFEFEDFAGFEVEAEPAGVAVFVAGGVPLVFGAFPDDFADGEAFGGGVEEAVDEVFPGGGADEGTHFVGEFDVGGGVGGGFDGGFDGGGGEGAGLEGAAVVGLAFLHVVGEGEEFIGLALAGGDHDGGEAGGGEAGGGGICPDFADELEVAGDFLGELAGLHGAAELVDEVGHGRGRIGNLRLEI